MAYIKFLNDETQYNVISIVPSEYSENAVKVTFSEVAREISGGFEYFDGIRKRPLGIYDDYKYVYKTEGNAVEFSKVDEGYIEPTRDITIEVVWNDMGDMDGIRPESVTVVATPSEGAEQNLTVTADNEWKYTLNDVLKHITYTFGCEVEGYETTVNGNVIANSHTHVETLDEIKAKKIKEMHNACSSMIYAGTNVTLSDGTTERFTFSDTAQQNITTAYNSASALINLGKTDVKVPFYTSDNKCEAYLPIDIVAIYLAFGSLTTFAVTLNHSLEQQINSLRSINTVEAVTYNVESLTGKYLENFNTMIATGQGVIDAIKAAMMPEE